MFSLFFRQLNELHFHTALLEIVGWDEDNLNEILRIWASTQIASTVKSPDELVEELIAALPEKFSDNQEDIKIYLKNSLVPYLIDNMMKINSNDIIGEC